MRRFPPSLLEELTEILGSESQDAINHKMVRFTEPWDFEDVVERSDRILIRLSRGGVPVEVVLLASDFGSQSGYPNASSYSNLAVALSTLLQEEIFWRDIEDFPGSTVRVAIGHDLEPL
jgi:hypothetical protein